MSRGLSGSVLGEHLGFEMPTLVRRAAGPAASAPVSEEPAQADSGLPPEQRADAEAQSVPAADDRGQEPSLTVDEGAKGKGRAAGSSRAKTSSKEAPPPALAVIPAPQPVPDPHPETTPQELPELRARSVFRVGTQQNPYERADGIKTQKLTFTGPWGLKRELEKFCAEYDLTRSEWIVETLRAEMKRIRETREPIT